jgi:phage terminase large subunit-like protein
MIEGRSGLIAAARDGAERRGLKWEPSRRRLVFASGAEAYVYSGANGEDLRGPEHHYAWCDELAKWRRAEVAWSNLMLGLRAGARPQALVTTTPRTVAALKQVLAQDNVVMTGGASRANPHLPDAFVREMERIHRGTRLERQELEGVMVEEVEGALWKRALIERSRCQAAPGRAEMRRVVVGVDPPATAGGDACGIVVCGVDEDGCAWVLGDYSEAGLSPEGWARKVALAAETWAADRVVAEGNQGGEMVEAVLRGAGLRLGVTRVHARVGKAVRAEPVAALFERGEAKLAGLFRELEEELAGLSAGGGYQGPGRSPDRADAMVYALTELVLSAPVAAPSLRFL